MPILVLSPRISQDSQALREAAIAEGWTVERLGDFVAPTEFKSYDAVIFGEAVFARLVAKSLDMVLLQTPLCWLAELPDQYKRRMISCTTLGEARQLSKPTFVKPAGEKSFIAQVYPSGDALPPANIVADTTPVLIVEPVEWDIEFRCFVLERNPITLSIYKRMGQLARAEDRRWLSLPEEIDAATTYCQTVLADPHVSVPPAFVMDIGIIRGRGWAVIEANPANASGIYGCDPVKILPVLKRASLKKDALSKSDEMWVVT